MGPGHRHPYRPTRSPAIAAPSMRWRSPSWTAARCLSPAATTGRCGCGTWPPALRVGRPFTGHRGPVNAVAAAELDGRPSSSPAAATGRCGCGTWPPAPRSATRFTGHGDWVRSVAVGELDGRPVVISGGDDRTVRVWDLATGAPVGDPFTGHDGLGVRGGRCRGGWPPGGYLRRQATGRCGCGTWPPAPRLATRFTGHERVGVRGGGRRTGRPSGDRLRQSRPDGAGVGPGYRCLGRPPSSPVIAAR